MVVSLAVLISMPLPQTWPFTQTSSLSYRAANQRAGTFALSGPHIYSGICADEVSAIAHSPQNIYIYSNLGSFLFL